MPTYVIHDTKKNKTFEVFCSWNVLQEKLKDNPHYKKVIMMHSKESKNLQNK